MRARRVVGGVGGPAEADEGLARGGPRTPRRLVGTAHRSPARDRRLHRRQRCRPSTSTTSRTTDNKECASQGPSRSRTCHRTALRSWTTTNSASRRGRTASTCGRRGPGYRYQGNCVGARLRGAICWSSCAWQVCSRRTRRTKSPSAPLTAGRARAMSAQRGASRRARPSGGQGYSSGR